MKNNKIPQMPVNLTAAICGNISTETFTNLLGSVLPMDSVKNKSGIWIILNSEGGSIHDGLAIYDLLRERKNDVIIKGYGKVTSIAAIIMQAAKIRILAPNTIMLLHNSLARADSTSMSLDDIDKIYKTGKYLNDLLIDIVSKRSGHPTKFITEIFNKEAVLTAKEALDYNLIDYIDDK